MKGSIVYFSIAITILIAVLSLVKIHQPSIKFTYLDKIEHIIAYFVLAICWFCTIHLKTKNNSLKKTVFFLCISYGILLEVLQGTLTSYRTADWKDMIANSIGVLIALLIFNKFFQKKLVN
ncbi:VanZ family protein [Lutibacter sp. Hel_I_33_5]|uniref:VanZ family protein n=1 Tax=Lutibacter sp. Hel_I_33_5 TaxID=1566289 RepID=UPI00210522A2|nr:VanZ family protein [Lutibacter sp. Hel_I_33_5]